MMSDSSLSTDLLFGDKLGWNPEDWTDSDDRVRGGRSQSYLKIEHGYAKFCGYLDIDALGGAGFASQRTTGGDRRWDLSRHDGIELVFDPSETDEKTYTFILKDEVLPKNPDNGREQSTVSWEVNFNKKDSHTCHEDSRFQHISIPWNALEPTYRGKPEADAKPLDKKDVKRMSIMMRSFFGTQSGEFSLNLVAIRAIPQRTPAVHALLPSLPHGDDDSTVNSLDKATLSKRQEPNQSIWSRFFCWSQKL